MLAAHRGLRLVLSAGLVSRSGDWILLTGLLYRVYVMTGSTAASALTMLSAFVVPRLVPDDQLVVANALSGQVGDISPLAGSALGGIVAAVGGITGVSLADAASFAASAALLALVRTSGAVRPEARRGHPLAAVAADLRGGLRLAARDRMLRALMIFGLITSVGEGIVGTLFAPFFRHVLHGSSQGFGLFMAAQAIGGIAGGVLAASLGQRVSASRLFSYGAVAFGLIDLAIFLYPLGYVATWPAMVGIIITGLPGALNMAGLLTLFQQNTEDAYRGRVFGAFAAAEGIAMLAGGYLTRPFSIIPVIAIQGAAYLAAGLLMAAWLRDRPAAPRRAARRLRPEPAQPGRADKAARSASDQRPLVVPGKADRHGRETGKLATERHHGHGPPPELPGQSAARVSAGTAGWPRLRRAGRGPRACARSWP